MESQWFEKLPLEEYLKVVEKYDPEKLSGDFIPPPDYTLSGLHIACGPLVRFLATHENNKQNYRGSIMIVLKDYNDPEPPSLTFIIGPASQNDMTQLSEASPINASVIYKEETFTFIRYSFEFFMQEFEQQVKYSIAGKCLPHFKFYIPAQDQTMNVMSYSCNGFSLGTKTSSFKGSLWLDVLRKHENGPHYHVMIGGGDQIYSDSISVSSEELGKWLKHKHIHSTEKLTDKMKQSFKHFYLNHYMKWFGKGFWEGTNGKTLQAMFPIALASIPQINIYDDHDIIDGFGSYRDMTMRQDIFRGVGRAAFKYYTLFQHHTLCDEAPDNEPSWIMGPKNGPYIDYPSRSIYARLGKSIAFLGLDCRTERTKHQVIYPETYDVAFQRVSNEIENAKTSGPIKHLYVLLGVPICYPRMVFIEKLMDSPLIRPILYLSRKGIIAPGLVNEFDGEVELLDDLNDHWCSHHHKKERNKLMARLIDFGKNHGVRITILSGDVHLACISRFRGDNETYFASPQSDLNFITNVISSAIVNAPPPDGMVKLLSSRTKKHLFSKSVKEDMIPLFKLEPNFQESRDYDMFINKRNFSDLIPVENLPKQFRKERFGEQFTDKYFKPNPVKGPCEFNDLKKNVEESKDTNGEIGYPYDDNAVIATIRVEIDMSKSDSKTGAYDLLIPPLIIRD
ncbi:hypothetical protein CANINC_004614 [Pichia inconspicua]|uniref:PhoD-like phosphatase domain-containing protein n=1 Tax=Pichia inconspicua TaxID=52247 RepID=A0A4T0WVS5_9ASCO|nr:hypothetical protein CANINC_004614 [[Candida] inconspicua]